MAVQQPDHPFECAMNESDMMHGDDWQGEDLADWLIGEKLNGCRVFWDGRELWTRNGSAVRIPAEWRSALPAVRQDCELWAGRGRFQEARLACQYGRFTPAVGLAVFDADVPGPFSGRQREARAAVAGLGFAGTVEYHPCESTAAALAMLDRVRAGGGEGIMARYPLNQYRKGRTREILKLKGLHHAAPRPQ